MARMERRWEERRANVPCMRCGFDAPGEEAVTGAGAGIVEDEGEQPLERRTAADVVRGLNQSVRENLPRWMRDRAGELDMERGADVVDGNGKGETEDSCLITPVESNEHTMASSSKGYGGVDESTPIVGVMDTQVQKKKKGKSRIIGEANTDLV